MYQQGATSQLPNGDEGVVVIPTIDGETALDSHEGARVHLLDLEVRFSERVTTTSNFLVSSSLFFNTIFLFPSPLPVSSARLV